MWRNLVLVVVVSEVWVSAAAAQPAAARPQPEPEAIAQELGSPEVRPTTTLQSLPPTEMITLSGLADDYRVGPGDRLKIDIVGHPDISDTLRISGSGEISFPIVGLVAVNDLTAFEVESAIADRLKEAGLLQQPDVLVSIVEYQAKPIYVWGAVVRPGEFTMSQQLTAVDAILLAGGLLTNAADEGFLYRKSPGSGQQPPSAGPVDASATGSATSEVIKVDVQAIRNGRFSSSAVPLRSGDVLIVPHQQMEMFFVVGDVLAPQNYLYPAGRTISASQAISWAGGPLPTASMSKGMLVRYDEAGIRTEIPVDYAAVLDGRQADFPIQKNDIIFVPSSKLKSMSVAFVSLADQMIMQRSFTIGRQIQMDQTGDRIVEDAGR